MLGMLRPTLGVIVTWLTLPIQIADSQRKILLFLIFTLKSSDVLARSEGPKIYASITRFCYRRQRKTETLLLNSVRNAHLNGRSISFQQPVQI